MKKVIIICGASLSLLLSSCEKEKAPSTETKSLPSTESLTPSQTISNDQIMAGPGWWEAFKKVIKDLYFGPTIVVSYKSGFYTSTPTTNNPDAYKCEPGDAICSFDIDITMSQQVQPDGWGIVALAKSNNGKLVMCIDKNSLSTNTYNEHYADGILNLPGEWKVQNGITSKLALPSNYIVQQGNYPIQVVTVGSTTVLKVIFN